MKKSHRRRAHGRRILLCLLALALLFVVLALRQNILLDTTSRHALLMDAQTGQVLAQKRANEKVAPASLTKMMTVLLAIEAQPDLDQPVTLPEDVFPELTAEMRPWRVLRPARRSRCGTCCMVPCCLPGPSAAKRWPGW